MKQKTLFFHDPPPQRGDLLRPACRRTAELEPALAEMLAPYGLTVSASVVTSGPPDDPRRLTLHLQVRRGDAVVFEFWPSSGRYRARGGDVTGRCSRPGALPDVIRHVLGLDA